MDLERKKMYESLRRRGMVISTDYQVIRPLQFSTKVSIPHKIMWLLNEVGLELNAKEISDFIGENQRSVNKALTNLSRIDDTGTYISRKRNGNGRNYYYTCNIPNGIDISSAYKTLLKYNKNKRYTKSKDQPSTVECNPKFPGHVLFSQPVLLTVGIDEEGNFKTTMSALPPKEGGS
jgi:hypothetical protein